MTEDMQIVAEDKTASQVELKENQADSESEENSEYKWLGTTAAAQYLGVTTRTLYRFIDEGHVAAYRLGRVIRVKTRDIDDFIEACRIQPGTISHLYPPLSPAEESAEEPAEEVRRQKKSWFERVAN